MKTAEKIKRICLIAIIYVLFLFIGGNYVSASSIDFGLMSNSSVDIMLKGASYKTVGFSKISGRYYHYQFTSWYIDGAYVGNNQSSTRTVQQLDHGRSVTAEEHYYYYNGWGSRQYRTRTHSWYVNAKAMTIIPPKGLSGGGGGSSGGGSGGGGGSYDDYDGGNSYVPPPDTTPPSCTVSANKSGMTNASQITYTVRFSENVNGFTQSDVSINKGSIASFTGSGSDYTVVVNTAQEDYTQTFSIGAGVCTDDAGNSSLASNTISIPIDRVAPVISFVEAKTNNAHNNKYASKATEITLKFRVTDNHMKTANYTKDTISLRVNGTNMSVGSSWTATQTAITNGYEYTLKVSGITHDGKLELIIPANKFLDEAGNGNEQDSSSDQSSMNITIDNTAPTVKVATLSGANQYGYVKNGKKVTLSMTFSEDLYTNPTVKIGGRVATLKAKEGSKKEFTASYTIPEKESTMAEGSLSIEINGYKDIVDLPGKKVTKTTDGSKIIYDRTPPKIDFIEPNGNSTWKKKQSTVVSASDNFTAKKDMICYHKWALPGEQVSLNDMKDRFVNEGEVSKNTGTGKFYVYLKIEDLAENVTTGVTQLFYLDNSVTEPGHIKITKNTAEGEIYPTHEKQTNVEEGGYTKDKLYLKKVDGKDDESGHKATSYEVKRILSDGTEIAIGTPTVEDTVLETDGDYRIIVTTWDKLDNQGTREYYVHKGTINVGFTPNGNSRYEKEVSTKISVTDTTGLANTIYYEWGKVGEHKPEEYTKVAQVGETLTLTDVTGDYILYVKTVDEDGNINYSQSEVFHVAGRVTSPGKMEFRENTVEGKTYEPDLFTKENIYMKVVDQGSTEYGGEVETTYQIKRITGGQEIVVGEKTKESTVLTKEGIYQVTMTSTSELGATTSETYSIKIDKTAPEVHFNGLEDYQTTGKIGVVVTDQGEAQSGLAMNTLRYYWTRNANKPSKEDFYGDSGEVGYRGELSSSSTSISAPKNVSGIWFLWIYAEDQVQNVAIKSNVKIDSDGNVSFVDHDPPIAGTLEMRENHKQGKEYIQGTFTKENIYLNLLNGYDADSGVKSNVYTITKEGQVISANLTGETTLRGTGIYQAKVTTTDNQDNVSTREYEIKIDQTGPKMEFIPDGNQEYAKRQEVTVSVTEPGTESGVNEEKTAFNWITYDPVRYESIEQVMEAIKTIVGAEDESQFTQELAQIGIKIILAEAKSGKVITPEGETGIYVLYGYSEDNVGNKTIKISQKGYYVDNTIPTKPEISGSTKQGNENVDYYGQMTNQEVTIVAKNSTSYSGVDRYEYSVSLDQGKTWSTWEEATVEENQDGQTVISGKGKINREGETWIKWRGVSELIDGTIEGIESDKFVVKIDKTGPTITFANHQDGQNGNDELTESIEVRATVTDQGIMSINENSLVYQWIYFESREKFEEMKKADAKTLLAAMTNPKSFKNGEELPSPKWAQGIYALVVYAEDGLGNASISMSNLYQLGKTEVEDSDYQIRDNMIVGVQAGTKVNDFRKKISWLLKEERIELYHQDQTSEQPQLLEENDLVTTGSYFTVQGTKYIICVSGDLNGDGVLDLRDTSRMQYHLVESKKLEGEFLLAADMNLDGNVDLSDFSLMVRSIAL